MADGSTIEWTEATWNPTTGCDRVSPGCDNCYALTLAKRLKGMGSRKYQRDVDAAATVVHRRDGRCRPDLSVEYALTTVGRWDAEVVPDGSA